VRPARWLAGAAALAALALLMREGRPKADAKVVELEEILRSRDDNDPRLDRDFVALPSETKDAFRAAYRALPRERLNERGTIVYLLGRNLTAPEDWLFFREVASEPPCLSLADCSKASASPGEPGDEVTLAYPSLVAVRQAARAAREGGSKQGARAVLEAARGSRAPAVTRLARTLDAGSTAP
jgi:hypothetical protein